MPHFDHDFESMRLRMLAEQHPSIVKTTGEITFYAEDNADYLSGASWNLEEDIFDKINNSDFKLHLMELLDQFIQYRGLCNQFPKKEGVVHFGKEKINIEWKN